MKRTDLIDPPEPAFHPLAPGLIVALLATNVAAGQVDAIVGTWVTEPSRSGRAHIEITRHGDQYRGRIAWIERPTYPEDDEKGMGGEPLIDRENPDPALRDRALVGLTILEGFHYRGDRTWSGGTIYDPENGKTYRCRMRLAETGELRIRGFVGLPLFGRTSVWTRLEKPRRDAPESPQR